MQISLPPHFFESLFQAGNCFSFLQQDFQEKDPRYPLGARRAWKQNHGTTTKTWGNNGGIDWLIDCDAGPTHKKTLRSTPRRDFFLGSWVGTKQFWSRQLTLTFHWYTCKDDKIGEPRVEAFLKKTRISQVLPSQAFWAVWWVWWFCRCPEF